MSDNISRADAIEAVDERWGDIKRTNKRVAKGHEAVYLDMRATISALPSADAVSREVYDKRTQADEEIIDSYRQEFQKALSALLSADAVQGWIPLSHDDDGLVTDFPYERDGKWVIVTDGKTISVERIKKDAYDHFFPNGRWFELEDVIAWMPLPKPYREDGEEE